MEKSKDPILTALDAAFTIASSLVQNATNQLKDFSQAENPATGDIDVEALIEREGLVRQDELVRLRSIIGELKVQVSELEEETKRLKKKLKTLKGKL
jgi:polyhydroxyalkanoate synthesis regulator phasin